MLGQWMRDSSLACNLALLEVFQQRLQAKLRSHMRSLPASERTAKTATLVLESMVRSLEPRIFHCKRCVCQA